MRSRIERREFLKRLFLAGGGAALGGCRLRLPAKTPPAPAQTLTLLHLNDLHGALYPKSGAGGAANVVGQIAQERAEAPGPVLLLDAGDAFQGTYVSNSNRGRAVIELMNLAGMDALALGNHEFDWGLDVLLARASEAHFPFLATNLETESGDRLAGIEPYTVIEAGGLQVGVLGLTYHDLRTIVRMSALNEVRSLPPREAVERYLPELQSRCDLIIVLSHLADSDNEALAQNVPGLPLIVAAHTHRALPGGKRIQDTLVVRTDGNGQQLGRVQLVFDEEKDLLDRETGVYLISIREGTASVEAEAIVTRWGDEADLLGSQVIGQAAAALPWRSQAGEQALGNLITDAMRTADLGDGQMGDIALYNDGGIRTSLDAGPITYAELYAVLPFDNVLVGLDLTGAQIQTMIEDSINEQGSQIQVSGMQFTWSPGKKKGERVSQIMIGGWVLEPESVYRVVTVDYLYTHPQYERSLGQGTDLIYGELHLDAVIEYVTAHSPVAPQIEGRIRRE